MPASSRFPRIRGDVPKPAMWPMPAERFSPHTRGCSEALTYNPYKDVVFPAYAGMFRSKMWHRPQKKSFPRIRGDVPKWCGWNRFC